MKDIAFSIMHKEEVCADITVADNTVKAVWHENSYPLPILGNGAFPLTPGHVMAYLKERCFDEHRPDREELLAGLGLSAYDPVAITKKTHGRMHMDFFWIRYKGENLTWNNVKDRI
jgi:hypothetical protein